MPPKATQNSGQKRKAIDLQDTDKLGKKATEDSGAPKVKRQKITVPSVLLRTCGIEPVRVDVAYEGETLSSLIKGRYVHSLKLAADNAFKLIATYTASTGEFEGKQIIVIEPAKPFKFLLLPPSVRKRIYTFYFANKNLVDEPIAFEGKRKSNGDIFAKTYANGSKNRVGLLATNTQVHDEALPVLYAKSFKMENSTAVLNLLTVVEDHLKEHLRSIRIVSWAKSGISAKQAMAFLVGANNLEFLWIGAGVASENDPAKAARNFWNDTSKLLIAIGNTMHGKIDSKTGATKDKTDAVAVFRFGKQALLTKEGTPYTKEQKEIFRSELRKRLE